MNSLKVRRVDLLEQLQERYDFMTKEKDKYEAARAKYFEDDAKYDIACAKYKQRVDDFLRGCASMGEINYTARRDRWSNSDALEYRVITEVTVTEAAVIQKVGPEPTRPMSPNKPDFLHERRGRGYSTEPSVYEAVYQAIAVLSLSNDEEVKAQMFNDALIAL